MARTLFMPKGKESERSFKKVVEQLDQIDLAILLIAPVYAGRIPEMAAKLFSQIDGHGMKAIVAVVYGNRDYDDALLELADIAIADGFEVIGAGAFIAQHCIFPKVANGRPDSSDNDKCITCCRCIAVCSTNARRFRGIMYATVEKFSVLKTPGGVNQSYSYDHKQINPHAKNRMGILSYHGFATSEIFVL